MKLGTVVDVHENSPLLLESGEVVVFNRVGDGRTGVFDLLEAVAEGGHNDRAIGEEVVGAVRPVDNAGDAVGFATCWTDGERGEGQRKSAR
jgi:hypothetical protein